MNAPSEAGTKNEKEQSSTLKSRPNGARERARDEETRVEVVRVAARELRGAAR